MSILIKGLEMPKSCDECFAELYSWCGIAQKPISDLTLKPQDCPLIELPPQWSIAFETFREIHEETPTIIEAEVER